MEAGPGDLGGRIDVTGAEPAHLTAVLELLREIGVFALRPSGVAAVQSPKGLSRSMDQNPAWNVPPCPLGSALMRAATAS